MNPRWIALAAGLAAVVAVFCFASRKESPATPGPEPENAVVAGEEPPAPVPAKLEPVASRPIPEAKRGITVPPMVEGSKADPNAPPQPAAVHQKNRDAALEKWRGVTVDLKMEDTTIHQFVAEIERQTGMRIGLDAGVPSGTSLSVHMSGCNGEDTVSMVADLFGLSWVVDDDGASWLVPKEKVALYEGPGAGEMREITAMEEALVAESAPAGAPVNDTLARNLDEQRISVSMQGVTLNRALGILAAIHSVPVNFHKMTVAESLAINVDLVANNETPREILKGLLEPNGLDLYVDGNSVKVGTRESIAELRSTREVEAAAKAKTTSTVKLSAEEEDVLSKTVAIEGEGLAIRDVADRISKALGIGYVIDPATWNRAAKYGFDGEPHTLKEIFAALAKGAPVRVVYREGKLWYLAR